MERMKWLCASIHGRPEPGLATRGPEEGRMQNDFQTAWLKPCPDTNRPRTANWNGHLQTGAWLARLRHPQHPRPARTSPRSVRLLGSGTVAAVGTIVMSCGKLNPEI